MTVPRTSSARLPTGCSRRCRQGIGRASSRSSACRRPSRDGCHRPSAVGNGRAADGRGGQAVRRAQVRSGGPGGSRRTCCRDAGPVTAPARPRLACPGPIHKTHEAMIRAFQAVQFAEAHDRVLFLAQGDTPRRPPIVPTPSCRTRAPAREDGCQSGDHHRDLQLWRLWLEDQPKGRKALERLHAEEGGAFAPSR